MQYIKTLFFTTICVLTLTSCSNTTLTGNVCEVETSVVDGITFFVVDTDNGKIGFNLDNMDKIETSQDAQTTLILSKVKVKYDINSKNSRLDSNMENITIYNAENVTVTKIYESNYS